MDLDYQPLVNFWKDIPCDGRIGLLQSPFSENEKFQNSLMASPPKHAFWEEYFKRVDVSGEWNSVLSGTGPQLYDLIIKDLYGDIHGDSFTNHVYIFPCEHYQRAIRKDPAFLFGIFGAAFGAVLGHLTLIA